MHLTTFAYSLLALIVFCPTVAAQTPPSNSVATPSDAELSDAVVTLATAPPPVLPSLSATGCGCCLKPHLSCRGPMACFCQPPLYYGTYPWDDDWTNPVLQCADGQCGNWWYERARAMVERKEACSQTVGGFHSPASPR